MATRTKETDTKVNELLETLLEQVNRMNREITALNKRIADVAIHCGYKITDDV